MKFTIFQITALILILGSNCNNPKTEVSFYYWKTSFKLNSTEKNLLRQNQVKCLYIRYFDVDLSAEKSPIPVSPVQFTDKPDSFLIVPVVYIKNKVMKQKGLDPEELARKIYLYIEQINKFNQLSCDEIQLDCDWTIESRENFMKFVQFFRKISKKTLSVTIRLHQVKYYYRTKVPDADYGVLMYYNMGKIAPDSLNSIFDAEVAAKYLEDLKKYPLKLDFALPIFSNTIQIRNQKVIALISNLSKADFNSDTNFYIQKENRYVVKNTNLKAGNYFMQNDEIKFESISFDDLKQMVVQLKRSSGKPPGKIIFFDLNSTHFNYDENDSQAFKKIADSF